MDGWWTEIDGQIEKALWRTGGLTPVERARATLRGLTAQEPGGVVVEDLARDRVG